MQMQRCEVSTFYLTWTYFIAYGVEKSSTNPNPIIISNPRIIFSVDWKEIISERFNILATIIIMDTTPTKTTLIKWRNRLLPYVCVCITFQIYKICVITTKTALIINTTWAGSFSKLKAAQTAVMNTILNTYQCQPGSVLVS